LAAAELYVGNLLRSALSALGHEFAEHLEKFHGVTASGTGAGSGWLKE
jgi:hypothetical protein